MSSGFIDLYDFRLRVSAMYAERDAALARGVDAATVWEQFWAARHDLFATHLQSALDEEQRRRFRALRVFPYDPSARVEAVLTTDVPPERFEVPTSGEEAMSMSLVGHLAFRYAGEDCSLSLYWIDVYGGGLFLPFRDTNTETYGGGRYLVDTVKGSTFLPLGGSPGNGRLLLDFNYAYNPSCAYNHRWVCPLAPPGNRLDISIAAGEMAHVEVAP
jgi:uncharacterized protein (DUF1684 family)